MTQDIDLELLEAHLDGALAPEETESLVSRLAAEPELAALLSALREERELRTAVWQSLAPAPGEAEQFAAGVIRSARRQRLLGRVGQISRTAVAAAACIMLGVGTGWYAWGRPAAAPPTLSRVNTGADTHLAADTAHAGPYQVAITDQDGNVVAVEKFNRLDEANKFADDLGRYQERRLDVQDGKATLVSDHF